MKWLRIIFAAFLVVGMLLGVSSVAYADDPPGDPGLNVDITISGDNPNVNADVLGANSQVTVNTSGTEVWINGQNLNEPTVIHQGSGTMGPREDELLGYAEDPYARNEIGEVILPWIEEAKARVDLVTEGLAKVILLAQENESELDTQVSLLEGHNERQTTLESETASLGERVNALEAQDAVIQAQITAKVNYLIASYNRMLIIIIGAFSLVVIGLGASLFLLWRRTRVSLPQT